MAASIEPLTLNQEEAARALGVDRNTFRLIAKKERFRVVYLGLSDSRPSGAGRGVRYIVSALQEWLDKNSYRLGELIEEAHAEENEQATAPAGV